MKDETLAPMHTEIRRLLSQWKQFRDEEDNDQFGRERASTLGDCINQLEAALLAASPAPEEETPYEELVTAVLQFSTMPRAQWSHQAIVALAEAHAQDSQSVDRAAPEEEGDSWQRLYNLVAHLAHPKGDHCENEEEDEAHDLLRALRESHQRLREVEHKLGISATSLGEKWRETSAELAALKSSSSPALPPQDAGRRRAIPGFVYVPHNDHDLEHPDLPSDSPSPQDEGRQEP